MGYQISGIIINSLPREFSQDELDGKKLKTKKSIGKIENFVPKDLSIAFNGKNTYIFLDQIFYKNITEDAELTNLENDLYVIFGDCEILIIAVNETVDISGYSYISNGVKKRTKMVVKDQIFLDYGELYDIEIQMLEQYKEFRRDNPRNLTKMRELYPGYSDDKLLIIDRDGNIKHFKNNKHLGEQLPYFYKDGTSDNYLIEKLFTDTVNHDFDSMLDLNWTIFERRRLNFKKDSLKEYLYLAMEGRTTDNT
jgi:hypothetical protein